MFQFLRRFFAKSDTSEPFGKRLHGSGTYSVQVVGESREAHKLELIWQATSNQWKRCDSPEGDFWERKIDARLISTSDAPKDACAIGVEISGTRVGNLARADALRIHRRLSQLGYDRIDAICDALITGRPDFWVLKLDIAANLVDEADVDDATAS